MSHDPLSDFEILRASDYIENADCVIPDPKLRFLSSFLVTLATYGANRKLR